MQLLGYKNWAFLNATGRTDMTSTLPYKNATYFYPAVSGTVDLDRRPQA
jgi:hypothetical protein